MRSWRVRISDLIQSCTRRSTYHSVPFLIDFLRSEDNLNPTEEAELCNLLYNAVLPGCYTPPTESGVPTQAIPLSEERNFEDAVQQTISCMLGDYSKFKRMETGEKWPDTDIENGCYGYFHLFDQDHTKKESAGNGVVHRG